MKLRSVGIVTGLYLAYLFIPMILLFVGSFGETWTNTLLPKGFTGDWYIELWGEGSFRRAFIVSIEVVAATCVCCTLLAVPLAYALYKSASKGVLAAARVVFLLPIAAPPLVLAFGFILIFNTETLPWLGSMWLLVAGHVVLTLPYLLQTLVTDMQHLDLDGLEMAAESLGAGFFRRFLDIVVPLLRYSLGSGLIMVAALSIGEFQLSNLISGFLYRPYPVVLLQAFYGATGFACAATVILLVLALLASAGGAFVANSASKLKTK